MKRSTVRLSLAFARLPKDEYNGFALLVLVCLPKYLGLFPNLPVSIAVLTALQAAFQDAMIAAAVGGPKDTAAQADARADLTVALRQIAAYLQSLNLTITQVLMTGYDVVIWSKNPITLVAPMGLTLDNSISGQLGVHFQALNGAKVYQVQYCTGTGAWLDVGVWPTTKGIVITELTPGTVYNVRVRGLGCSTRYGPWSGVVSLMCV